MKKCILTLSSRFKDDNQENEKMDAGKEDSEHELLTKASRYLFSFNIFVGAHDFETALEHIKLMKTIHDLIPHSDEMKQSMGMHTYYTPITDISTPLCLRILIVIPILNRKNYKIILATRLETAIVSYNVLFEDVVFCYIVSNESNSTAC